jgi:16S rRNA (uracil1498-N3)-methyltransferase
MIEGDLILFREGFLPIPKLTLTTEEWSHLRARRLNKEESRIEIRDGFGKSFLYLYLPDRKELSYQTERVLNGVTSSLRLAIALPKGNRLDFFLQKATEIGLTKVYFCEFEYSIRKEFNLDRAKKIVSEAASQSKQPVLLQMEIVRARDWLKKEKDHVLLLDPHAETQFQMKDLKDHIPVIGPEGGFSKEEISLFQELSIQRVKWEGGILRTETAGIVAASLLAYGV